MTKKRFEIYDEENGYVRDNKTGNSYSACGGGDGFPFIIDEYHKLQKENEQLKKLLKCSREEANDYCEELMAKDEFIRLYKRQRDEAIEENKQLQTKNDIDRNCYNCKHCETYDEGPGYGFVSLCEKDCMNTDGYFDYEFHKFKSPVACPFWEHGDDS